jgi:hypothetical protein
MPTRISTWVRASEFSGIGEAKLDRPAADGLIRNINASLSQKVLDVSKAERKSKIQPNGVLDDFNWKAVAVIAEIAHRSLIPHEVSARS